MATEVYHIKVLDKSNCDVKLRVRINCDDWDSTPAATEHQFFLRLLTDPANTAGKVNTKLEEDLENQLEETSEETAEEDDPTQKYWELVAARYIRQVVQLDSRNFPAETNAALQSGARDDYDALPYTDYLVTATDKRWVRHVRPGEEWGTVLTEEFYY